MILQTKHEDIIELMRELDTHLIRLFKGLSACQWHLKTISPKWNVKDIAAHLLDGNLRTLSVLRDGYFGETPGKISSYADLVGFLDSLNADWVNATKRLSPEVIIEWLKTSGEEYVSYLSTLDSDAKATFSVAWAGENESTNRFHIAREYTEKWHHQQQIRCAVGDGLFLLQEKWFRPYLETSLCALPHHYRTVKGREGDVISFTFTGGVEKTWHLQYSDTWQFVDDVQATPAGQIRIPDDVAWRIFTKGIQKEDAIQQSEISGDPSLTRHFFDMIAIMG